MGTKPAHERRGLVASGLALLCATVLTVGLGVQEGGAQQDTPVQVAQNPLSITFVARACPAYSDIMANKARNNLQESATG